MIKYRSDYPNQVHQLNVSISQHHHLLKDGTIKWQEKKLDVNWSNYSKTNRTHLVTFIIRDHFSSCFYAELHSIDNMPSIEDFLFNAWSKKNDYEFYGVGHNVIIPQKTIDQFPSLKNFFDRVENISLIIPNSGFSSAIRSILEWERKIRFARDINYRDITNLFDFQSNIDIINKIMNQGYGFKDDNNLNKWINGNPRITSIKSKEDFLEFFRPIRINC